MRKPFLELMNSPERVVEGLKKCMAADRQYFADNPKVVSRIRALCPGEQLAAIANLGREFPVHTRAWVRQGEGTQLIYRFLEHEP